MSFLHTPCTCHQCTLKHLHSILPIDTLIANAPPKMTTPNVNLTIAISTAKYATRYTKYMIILKFMQIYTSKIMKCNIKQHTKIKQLFMQMKFRTDANVVIATIEFIINKLYSGHSYTR